MKPIIGLVVAIAVGATGCAKQDFLFHRIPPTPKQRSFTHTARSFQVSGSRMNILWVIDNSGSMSIYQKSVIQNTERFMRRFVASRVIDWKMGLISTTVRDDPYVGLTPQTALDSTSVDPIGTFQDAVGKLGTNGDYDELTFTPILNTLGKYPAFSPPGEQLSVIVVTDADEQSKISGKDFLSYIQAFKPAMDSFAMYGATADTATDCKGESTIPYLGSPYEFVITATQGLWFSLCDPDFGTQLAAISDRIIERVDHPRVYLDVHPIPRTIRLYYNGLELPPGPAESGGYWVYEISTNSIIFNSLEVFKDDDPIVSIEYTEDQGEPE